MGGGVISALQIDPVAFALGPLIVRWYSLAYLAGIVLGWCMLTRLQQHTPLGGVSGKTLEDMVMIATLGIVLGGRLGYCLVYHPAYYAAHPSAILAVWKGGMSFHGGMVGVAVFLYGFCRVRHLPFLAVMDRIALVAPVGLFFGRIANFINGELFGRISDVPWAMVFAHGGPFPRHPSQLYQAGMEGMVLFLLLWAAWRKTSMPAYAGRMAGMFLVGYGVLRVVGEWFREPDAQLGFLAAGMTMGQLLSVPMVLLGAYLLRRREVP